MGARKPENAGCVLVVDDEAEVLAAVERSLRRRGFEVHTAATAGEVRIALDALRDRLDVILLDWVLADSTAEFLVEHFHRERIHASLVVFTAYDPLPVATAARGLRADGFVHKSDPHAVRRAVESAAWRAHERRQWPAQLEKPIFADGDAFLDWKARKACLLARTRDRKDRDILRLRIAGFSKTPMSPKNWRYQKVRLRNACTTL